VITTPEDYINGIIRKQNELYLKNNQPIKVTERTNTTVIEKGKIK
jgi:hypothetical protein